MVAAKWKGVFLLKVRGQNGSKSYEQGGKNAGILYEV